MCPGFTADQMIQNLWDWELDIIFSFQHFSSESNVESGVKTILLMNHKCIHSFIRPLITQTLMTNYPVLIIQDSEDIRQSPKELIIGNG